MTGGHAPHRVGPPATSIPLLPLSFQASLIVIPSRRRGISPHRCAEIPRPRSARGLGMTLDGAPRGLGMTTGAPRGLAMTGGDAPHRVSPPATSIPHRPLSFQASLIVIPSRRRGISAHRCAEIPRPRYARPRDDRGCSARPRDDQERCERPRDDRGALRADSGWRRRVMRPDSGSQVRYCARLQEDGDLCRAWPAKAAAD
jgi:hypothetical protein